MFHRQNGIFAAPMLPAETTSTRTQWRDMLATVLHRNLKVQEEWSRDRSRLTLKVPTKRPGYLVPPLSWIIRPPAFRSIELDPTGAQVWEWCNGQNNVEEVAVKFARQHNLTFHESRVSVTNYMKELVRRGALAIAI